MNDTTFRGDGKVAYVPVVVNAKPPKTTNYDRLRAKSVEEMAEFFTPDYYDGPKFYCPVQPIIGEGECAMRSDCRQCWLDWLKQEVAE